MTAVNRLTGFRPRMNVRTIGRSSAFPRSVLIRSEIMNLSSANTPANSSGIYMGYRYRPPAGSPNVTVCATRRTPRYISAKPPNRQNELHCCDAPPCLQRKNTRKMATASASKTMAVNAEAAIRTASDGNQNSTHRDRSARVALRISGKVSFDGGLGPVGAPDSKVLRSIHRPMGIREINAYAAHCFTLSSSATPGRKSNSGMAATSTVMPRYRVRQAKAVNTPAQTKSVRLPSRTNLSIQINDSVVNRMKGVSDMA